ncbi:unnamed protein product [Gongylonema pulchrum]|uniref:Myb_DNA-bind_5 domain-containing protein n=1 Tax=Gongylonema pulchrum TaxID=637853 RepID=A0A183E7V6_9BILA|nr:unnamed protein product [Gongylonema pulchrum]
MAANVSKDAKFIRHTAVTLSPEELLKLESRIAEEDARKKKLEEVYETRKMENERRLQLESQLEKAFALEIEAKREAAAAANVASSTTASVALPTHLQQDSADSTRPVDLEERRYVWEPDLDRITEPAEPPVRLNQLQSLLDEVNASLNSNSADFLGETLVGDDGRIRLSDWQQTIRARGTSARVSFKLWERVLHQPGQTDW